MKYMIPPEFLTPYIISNALAVWTLWLAIRKPHVAKAVLSILFIGSGGFNIYTVWSNPTAYMAYAETSFIPFYTEFIRGPFASNTGIFISVIAAGQLFVGISMLMENVRFKAGCVGGIAFCVAIAPLGVGSAFPSTLVLASAFLILFVRKETTASTS